MLTSNLKQERSSAKRKELYRTVQTKAGVSHPTQLLINMKVRWSSTYVMLNRAESNKKVHVWYCYVIQMLVILFLILTIACRHVRIRDRSARAWFAKTSKDWLPEIIIYWMEACRPIHRSSFSMLLFYKISYLFLPSLLSMQMWLNKHFLQNKVQLSTSLSPH